MSIPQDKKRQLYQVLQNAKMMSELQFYSYAGHYAKQYNMPKDDFLKEMREYAKEQLICPDKMRHYHRTSLEKFESIMNTGKLMCRKELAKQGIDTSKLLGSSSNYVQFTHDYFNKDGELVRPGYLREEGVGAAGNDVVFVFGQKLFEEPGYDCFGLYPTVETASIKDCCIAILARDEKVLEKVQETLKEHKIDFKDDVYVLNEEFMDLIYSKDIIIKNRSRKFKNILKDYIEKLRKSL
jgi:phosphoribosyl-ATP pyrophosphohydrolase